MRGEMGFGPGEQARDFKAKGEQKPKGGTDAFAEFQKRLAEEALNPSKEFQRVGRLEASLGAPKGTDAAASGNETVFVVTGEEEDSENQEDKPDGLAAETALD